jgi:excisionase family DNA binding protein
MANLASSVDVPLYFTLEERAFYITSVAVPFEADECGNLPHPNDMIVLDAAEPEQTRWWNLVAEAVDAAFEDPRTATDAEIEAVIRLVVSREKHAVPFINAQLTTAQAADELGVSQRRVQAMIEAGQLTASKYGRDWMISMVALNAVRDRKPGRPSTR